MLVPMQLQFNISFNEDDEIIHAANRVHAGRVVIDRFLLWLPKLTPKDSLYSRFSKRSGVTTDLKNVKKLNFQPPSATFFREM